MVVLFKERKRLNGQYEPLTEAGTSHSGSPKIKNLAKVFHDKVKDTPYRVMTSDKALRLEIDPQNDEFKKQVEAGLKEVKIITLIDNHKSNSLIKIEENAFVDIRSGNDPNKINLVKVGYSGGRSISFSKKAALDSTMKWNVSNWTNPNALQVLVDSTLKEHHIKTELDAISKIGLFGASFGVICLLFGLASVLFNWLLF